jgi:hypothetical protein
MNPSLPTHVDISPEALFQELEGETVLLNLQSERYYGLDDVGTRMWQLLAEDGDVGAAYQQLLQEYNVEAARLEADLATLIGRLAEAGLLTVTAPGGGAD